MSPIIATEAYNNFLKPIRKTNKRRIKPMREIKYTILAYNTNELDDEMPEMTQIILTDSTSQKAIEHAKRLFQADDYKIVKIEE